MNRIKPVLVKKTDFIIIAAVFAVCIAAGGFYRLSCREGRAQAQIFDHGILTATVDLDTGTDKIFSLPGNSNVVFHLYADGSICFDSSDCPDKICVMSGRLRLPGQSAACLPNGIVLRVVAADETADYEADVVIDR